MLAFHVSRVEFSSRDLGQLLRVVLLESHTSEMAPLQFPNGHVLVPTGDELVVSIGVKLEGVHGQVADVSKRQSGVLLP